MDSLYAVALPAYISRGIELELLAPELAEFDLERLGAILLPSATCSSLPRPADVVRPLLHSQQ
jgi:hypothetical protein